MSRRDDDRRFHDYARYTLSSFREPIAPVETTDEIRRAREIVKRVKANSYRYAASSRIFRGAA